MQSLEGTDWKLQACRRCEMTALCRSIVADRVRRPLCRWFTRPAPDDGWQRGGASTVTLVQSEGPLSPQLVPQPLAGRGPPPSCCARLLSLRQAGRHEGSSELRLAVLFPSPLDKEWDPHCCPEPGNGR